MVDKELELIKVALEKNNSVNLLKLLTDREKFEFIPEQDVSAVKNILIIGVANISQSIKLIEKINPSSNIIILEEDHNIFSNFEKQLQYVIQERELKNCKLYKCYWDNLKINIGLLNEHLRQSIISDITQFELLNKHIERQCKESPLIYDGWADLVYIGTFNRHSPDLSERLLSQAFNLSSRYGEILLDIILSDERLGKTVISPYQNIKFENNLLEEDIIPLLLRHDYHGVSYLWRSDLPTMIIEGTEMRAFQLKGFKGKQGICLEKGHAVFYRGPWREVIDDDGHKLIRGQRMAVCEKTYNVLTKEPYQDDVIGIKPYYDITDSEAGLFDCTTRPQREPKVTKGLKLLVADKSDDILENTKCC